MPYFHVLVANKASPTRLECILWDLDEAALQKQFVKPFVASDDIVVQGRIHSRSEMAVVRIQATEESSAPALRRLQDESWAAIQKFNRESEGVVFVSAGDGHSRNDLHMVGIDVTARYLGTDALSTSQSWRVKENPWLVTVGGGLVVIAIAAAVAALL